MSSSKKQQLCRHPISCRLPTNTRSQKTGSTHAFTVFEFFAMIILLSEWLVNSK